MIGLISFTETGQCLAQRLASALDGQAVRCGAGQSLAGWTEEHFQQGNALIFVGAVGIAVRAVAPHVKSKTTDPAVVVVDEMGRFAIPLLSGHLGGANDLARQVAAICGAVPVITTATDLHGLFAVDQWARRQNCAIDNPERIKAVSGALLRGGTVEVCSPWPVSGQPPARVTLTLQGADADALRVIPRIVTLGVGCKRGTSREVLEAAFTALLAQETICERAVCKVCTIDLKKEEPGLLAFCAAHRLPLETFSAQALAAVEGEFPSSEFVKAVTGVDNVCQRAAVLGSGGRLLGGRYAKQGVTMALAQGPFTPDWRWTDE